jgi:hypothetical protein
LTDQILGHQRVGVEFEAVGADLRNRVQLGVDGRIVRQHEGHVLLVALEEVRVVVGGGDRHAAVEQIGLGADLEGAAGFRTIGKAAEAFRPEVTSYALPLWPVAVMV